MILAFIIIGRVNRYDSTLSSTRDIGSTAKIVNGPLWSCFVESYSPAIVPSTSVDT